MAHEWKPGFYTMKNGRKAEVIAVRGKMVIGMDGDELESWSLDGQYLPLDTSTLDLDPNSWQPV